MLFYRILFTLDADKLTLLTKSRKALLGVYKTQNRVGKSKDRQYHIEIDENNESVV